MSMIGNLARLPEETLEKLQQDPELIQSFLYHEFMPPPAKPGFFSSLFGGKTKQSEPVPAPIEPLVEGDRIDFDKTWQVLHFLFTGSDWEGDFPEGFLVSCGEPIGEEDVGYGPARSFRPDEVQKIAAFLNTQDESSLKSRYNLEKLVELEIYPQFTADTSDAEMEETWEYYVEGFRQVKKFVSETAEANKALIVYLN